jgi:hypothetical protein
MNETQLQIVVSLINDAADQLIEVGDQISALGTQATEAATQMTDSFDAANESLANAAMQATQSWTEAEDGIEENAEGVQAAWDAAMEHITTANASVSDEIIAQWQAQGEAMEASIAQTMAEVDATMESGAAAAGEAAGTAAGSGFFSAFRQLMVGYALEKIGEFLSGGISAAVTAAQQSSDKIASLTSQIDQQRASIAVNDAALQKWTGTTVEVNAAHEKAATNIQAETLKIQELQQQLAPLQQAQDGLAGSITNVENAILDWIGTQSQLEKFLQVFTTTLGPLLEFAGAFLIVITMFTLALTFIDPVWLLIIALAVAVAAATAIWTTFHTQIMAFLNDLNANSGIIDFFKDAWQSVSDNFNSELLPALEQLWTALQPLKPFLEALAIVIGATLLGAVVLLVDALTTAINIFTELLTIATNVATFFTTVLVGAINKVESAISALVSSSGFKAVSSIVGGVASGVSNVLGSIPGFAAGGIVTSPTLALVGEAGPEAIIPLSAFSGGSSLAGGGGLSSGGGITININGGQFLNQGGAQQIAQALATMIGRQLKLTTI